MVARRILSVSRNVVQRPADMPWLVFKWSSDDLGLAAPTDADFVIAADREEPIGGLQPRKGKSPTALDLKKVAASDLLPGRRAPPMPHAARRAWFWPSLFVANAILLTAMYLRLRHKGSRGS